MSDSFRKTCLEGVVWVLRTAFTDIRWKELGARGGAGDVNKNIQLFQRLRRLLLMPLTLDGSLLQGANSGFGGSAGQKEWYESGHPDLPNRR